MNIEVEVLSELYIIMKQYVPQKDIQECADNLMSSMVDMLGDQELKEFGRTDSHLRSALKEYTSESEDDIDDDEKDDSDW
jgi:uncharacterized protein YqeY